eukprot:jgi/Mesen1/7118/ME000369S06459
MEVGIQLPQRSTRGQRMTKLVVEDQEADEEFWNQEALKEDEEDIEYVSEGDVEDEFDSDFGEDEPESEDGEADLEKRPKRPKKVLLGVQKTIKKKNKAGPGSARAGAGAAAGDEGAPASGKGSRHATALEEAAEAAAEGRPLSPSRKSRKSSARRQQQNESDRLGEVVAGGDDDYSPGGAQGEVRKSSRTAVVVRAIERQAIKAAQEATPRVAKRKKGPEEERRWTQEEMLLEAAQTEIKNRQSLEIMLAREEEVKRKALIQKEVYSGPLIRLHSKLGVNVLEFTHVSELPDVINSIAPPYPKRAMCAVTGLPAKYLDPLTRLPYATIEAFQILRTRGGAGGSSGRRNSRDGSGAPRASVGGGGGGGDEGGGRLSDSPSSSDSGGSSGDDDEDVIDGNEEENRGQAYEEREGQQRRRLQA